MASSALTWGEPEGGYVVGYGTSRIPRGVQLRADDESSRTGYGGYAVATGALRYHRVLAPCAASSRSCCPSSRLPDLATSRGPVPAVPGGQQVAVFRLARGVRAFVCAHVREPLAVFGLGHQVWYGVGEADGQRLERLAEALYPELALHCNQVTRPSTATRWPNVRQPD
jgi:hypothetical protein